MERPLMGHLLMLGIPMAFQNMVISVGGMIVQTVINGFGVVFIAGFTATNKLYGLLETAATSYGYAMVTYAGQNLGAGEIRRIKEGIKKSVLYSWIWCLGVIVVTWLFAPDLIYLVTGSSNPVVIKNAVAYLRFDTLFYFVTALICVIRNAMQGIGDHITPLVSSSLELVGKVVFALIFVPLLGYRGVILAEPVSWFIMVVPLLIQICRTPILKEKRAD